MFKVIEVCPFCMEEVELESILFDRQKCPNCGNMIRACCLCDMSDTLDCTWCSDEGSK